MGANGEQQIREKFKRDWWLLLGWVHTERRYRNQFECLLGNNKYSTECTAFRKKSQIHLPPSLLRLLWVRRKINYCDESSKGFLLRKWREINLLVYYIHNCLSLVERSDGEWVRRVLPDLWSTCCNRAYVELWVVGKQVNRDTPHTKFYGWNRNIRPLELLFSPPTKDDYTGVSYN